MTTDRKGPLMRLRYLATNQTWAFTFGDEVVSMGGERFFKSRKEAREAGIRQNLLADDRTGVVTPT